MVDKSLQERVASMAQQHVSSGDVSGWFDKLYAQAEGDMRQLPWATGEANPSLLRWLSEEKNELVAGVVRAEGVRHHGGGPGRGRAVVVGCGLGDDAEALADKGYDVVAFDVAETSVKWCQERFPDSAVSYRTADLFELPETWKGSFDLVYDGYTLQSLPPDVRNKALDALVSLGVPHGRLLLIAFARGEGDSPGGPPWPVSQLELEYLDDNGLRLNRFEDFMHRDGEAIRHFLAEYQLAGPSMGRLSGLHHWHGGFGF